MPRYIIYVPGGRTHDGQTKLFRGFVSVHPGTEPRGHEEARWDICVALLIEAENLDQCLKDLATVGDAGFLVKEVDL